MGSVQLLKIFIFINICRLEAASQELGLLEKSSPHFYLFFF